MFVSLNLFTFPFWSVLLLLDPWLPENAYLNLAVNRPLFPFTSFVLESSTDSFCLTALTLAGQVPPVPVCTLLWLVPQTVCPCNFNINQELTHTLLLSSCTFTCLYTSVASLPACTSVASSSDSLPVQFQHQPWNDTYTIAKLVLFQHQPQIHIY